MHSEDRRSFVKKSLATSVSISFTGLIRAAHGETVTTIPETTSQWNVSTIDQWTGGGSTDTLGLSVEIPTTYDIFSDVSTIDQWSAWSIDPVTDPPTGNTTINPLLPCDQRNPKQAHQYIWTPYGLGGYDMKGECTVCGNIAYQNVPPMF